LWRDCFVDSIVTAADKVSAGRKGGPQAIAVATLVIWQEVLIKSAVQPQQAVPCPGSARTHTHDDKQT